jgi:hypothetical protein
MLWEILAALVAFLAMGATLAYLIGSAELATLFKLLRGGTKPTLSELYDQVGENSFQDHPQWVLLTRSPQTWTTSQVAEICARLWQLPVNQQKHDAQSVTGEAPYFVLHNSGWHILFTCGDEPFLSSEQISPDRGTAYHELIDAHNSWLSLEIVDTPLGTNPRGDEALRHVAVLLAALGNEQGLVLLEPTHGAMSVWTKSLHEQLRQEEVAALQTSGQSN